jgi:hypothetical protein
VEGFQFLSSVCHEVGARPCGVVQEKGHAEMPECPFSFAFAGGFRL